MTLGKLGESHEKKSVPSLVKYLTVQITLHHGVIIQVDIMIMPVTNSRLVSSFLLPRNMSLFLNYFQKKYTNNQKDPRVEKICVFNSIVSNLAQIQQGPPFGNNKYTNGNPPSDADKAQLKLSNTFAHLVVSSTEVVAITLYTLDELLLLTWTQAQNSDDGKRETAQDTQKKTKARSKWQSVLSGIGWLFASNTPNNAMRPNNMYTSPSIITAAPPADYPEIHSEEALIQYLNNFLTKKW